MTKPEIEHEARPPIDFTPVVRTKERSDGWTPQRQREFISMIAATGNIGTACKALGMSQRSLYNLRRMDGAESFRAAWDAALVRGTDAIRAKLIDHSLNGIPEPVYYAGAQVGERRRFNHRSMMWMVERGDRAKSGEPLTKGELEEWRAQRAMHAKRARKAVEHVAKLLGMRL
jgi:hypothetical protein